MNTINIISELCEEETVNPTEAPTEEVAEAQTEETVNPAEEEAEEETEAQTDEAVKEPEVVLPSVVTREDIRDFAVLLAQKGKATEAGDIIMAYAKCISDIPEDKLDEVFVKLSDLEATAQ